MHRHDDDGGASGLCCFVVLALFVCVDLVGKPNCTFQAGDPAANVTEICAFEVDWEPAGPFLTAQYSFFVPRVRRLLLSANNSHVLATLFRFMRQTLCCKAPVLTYWWG